MKWFSDLAKSVKNGQKAGLNKIHAQTVAGHHGGQNCGLLGRWAVRTSSQWLKLPGIKDHRAGSFDSLGVGAAAARGCGSHQLLTVVVLGNLLEKTGIDLDHLRHPFYQTGGVKGWRVCDIILNGIQF